MPDQRLRVIKEQFEPRLCWRGRGQGKSRLGPRGLLVEAAADAWGRLHWRRNQIQQVVDGAGGLSEGRQSTKRYP
ncbi:hypothetical protein PG985_009518 [Apiospora marii]|uniref:uncharacterized protein n=1 Tax=Apiospora marii TaxID=335849 RepID=UPI00313011D7